jgi:hypothetical protein
LEQEYKLKQGLIKRLTIQPKRGQQLKFKKAQIVDVPDDESDRDEELEIEKGANIISQ